MIPIPFAKPFTTGNEPNQPSRPPPMTDTASAGSAWSSSPWLWFSGLVLLLCYLYLGTGVHSDDYANIQLSRGWGVIDWLTLYRKSDIFFYFLPTLYFDFALFALYGYEPAYYDVAKVFISLFAVAAAFLFAKQYLDQARAFLFAALFVLYPTHDATNFWFTGSYLLVTGAWVMLSHVLLNSGRTVAGMGAGLLGAFWSYASPPLIGGLSLAFLFRRDYRKFVLFVLPEALYVAYYLAVSKLLDTSNFRTKDISSLVSIAKQFLLQVGSFVDAVIGPSFWLKVSGSVQSLDAASALVAVVATIAASRLLPAVRTIDKALLGAFLAVALFGFLIFAVTGGYPQLAFNLGNRVTYFGSLLLAFLLVSMPVPRVAAIALIAVVCFSTAGLSDHWKAWNDTQLKVMAAIRLNPGLAIYEGDTLFVSGSQYSRLGGMSHIEFFSESYVAGSVFQAAFGRPLPYGVRTLNHRFREESGWLSDTKYEGQQVPVADGITVYDSVSNRLDYVPVSEINQYIAALPRDTRHWVQNLNDGPLRRLVLFLMPRLGYAFL